MLPRPTLNRTAQAAVRELRVDHGVEPTLDEILWLHELGKVVENPIAGERLDLIGTPAKAGNVYLWPMTIMAAQWFNNRAVRWFGRSRPLLTYVLAFALAHGRGDPLPEPAGRGWLERLVRKLFDLRNPLCLDDLVDRDQAFVVVRRWAARLGCTRAELESAIDLVLPQADAVAAADTAPQPALDTEAVVNDLAVLTGTDPALWRRTEQSRVFHAFQRACAIERARQHKEGAPLRDPLADAIQDMRRAIVEIIKAHREQQNETPAS